MKHIFTFLIIVFLLLVPFTLAQSVVNGKGFTKTSVNTGTRNLFNGPGYVRIYDNDVYPYESAVYNYRKTGVEKGRNPFYLRSSSNGGINSHIFLRSQVDEQILKNPSLMNVRGMQNNHRYTRGFDVNGGHAKASGKGWFNLFHAQNQPTGRIRTHVNCLFC